MGLFVSLPLRRLALVALLAAAPVRAQELPPDVRAALVQSRLPPDAVTILVAPVDPALPARVAHRADAVVNPASIAKLVTTFAGLDLLGPAFTWPTSVYLDRAPRDGVLRGNLYLRGQGDPQLVVERLWLLLRRIQSLGVRHVTGDIVLDRSAFALPPPDPGRFDGEPLRPYNAAPDALLINYRSAVWTFTPVGQEARVHVMPPLAGMQSPSAVPLSDGPCDNWRADLRADFSDPLRPRFAGRYPRACGERDWPVADPHPASHAERTIAALWREVGGTLAGRVRDGTVPAGLSPAMDVRSPVLAETVRDINKHSNNVMAQQLFLTLSLQTRGIGTFDGSREVLRQWWAARLGGEPPLIDNGSGLSRETRATAWQLARLLQLAWGSPLMPELVASLPVTGTDGTLRRATRNVGLAHLKTGSLRDVTGVAGYVHAANGRRWVVVAIANHPEASAFRPVIDALVNWAARQP